MTFFEILLIFENYEVLAMDMKRKFLSIALCLLPFAAHADEGMWMVNALSEALVRNMQASGLKLDAGEIYSEDEVSLKDAIVSLDFGCTGSMVSERGLLITNHHCAYSDIHALSTAGHNYLEDGFFAKSEREEIYIPGKSAYFLKKVLDVTDEVNTLIEEEAAAGRPHGSRRISSIIERKYSTATGYDASLSSMWAGSRYYLALYEVYTDIRLVAAPPVSIAAFGGDIDNWEWPQHKCDFALYRIYAGADGRPAEHSEGNLPLRPAKYLQISTEGVQPGDFTMIMGYPGSTARYSSEAKVDYRASLALPISNRVRADQMRIMKSWMDADPGIRLKYSDRYFSLSNVQENDEGFVQNVRRFDVPKRIRREDRRLRRSERELFRELDDTYREVREAEKNRIYYRETIVRGTQLGLIAMRLRNSRSPLDMEEQYAGIDLRVEKDLFRYCLQTYFENVDSSYWGPFQKETYARYGNDWDAMCGALWVDRPMTVDDGIYKFFNDVQIRAFNEVIDDIEGDRDRTGLDREYTRAKYRMRLGRGETQYPDANSTMRLTYGEVGSFERDGIMLPWQTTASGILAKEDPGSYDFHLLPAWKEALEKSIASGEDLPVDFLTDNDITGGNSGSPVLDAEGRLVGLAFDGNKESLASDVYWTEGYNKCVNVDIRFVLWTLRNYMHADYILDELSIDGMKEMENPLLAESTLPYGAPQFDRIRPEHYMPAFKEAMAEGRAEIDAITSNPEAPTFENTIEALEYSGRKLDRVSNIFYNLLEADTNPQMQQIAEQLAPLMNEYSMYISLNGELFKRVRAVWDNRGSLSLDKDQQKLLEDTYLSFRRNGAELSPEDKETLTKYREELSLLTLQFSNNALAATNAWTLHVEDEDGLAGLPGYVRDMGASLAAEKGVQGWLFDLSQPVYSAFMKYSGRPDLRKEYYIAYNSRAFGGEFDNSDICRRIANLRLQTARLLGYDSYDAYVLEERMAKDRAGVDRLLQTLMEPSLPAARQEMAELLSYAADNGYTGDCMQPWDYSYWSERYRESRYSLSEEMLKPYFQLDSCIEAVFGLATRLYGLQFTPRPDIPGYHPDVRVYEVCDSDGRHLALFYADFFPRESKRGGAWMTTFRGQSIENGVETRPLVSIVTNFTKPSSDAPALLTHYELTTFLHEFGHSLHAIMAEGRYPSLTGTNVAWDFVELPSQIMENWAYEPGYLKPFARHYLTGEEIPDEYIASLVESRNYMAAYAQVRQLQYGMIDLAWNAVKEPIELGAKEVEAAAVAPYEVMPDVPECCMSTSFSHIFSGGYAAGYYSYKWAEVLAADAYGAFIENGIFSRETADSFRRNILSRGGSEDEAVLYRNFRGHDPDPGALLDKLGIKHD